MKITLNKYHASDALFFIRNTKTKIFDSQGWKSIKIRDELNDQTGLNKIQFIDGNFSSRS